MNYGIILAGGSGIRAGGGIPKQFREVQGKPVIAYTIEIYEQHPEIEAMIVGCHVEWLAYLDKLIYENGYKKVKWIATGGDTFQETVINCVNKLRGEIDDDDIAVVQYGAMPFTKPEIISDGIRVAKEKRMSFSATPCYQLMGTYDRNGVSEKYVDRLDYIQVASPQSYQFGYLKHIYDEGKRRGLLDKVDPHTTSLMSALGYPLYASYGDQTNVKITTKEDLELFEGWVLMKQRKAHEKDRAAFYYYP